MPPEPVSARQKKKGGSGDCRSLPRCSVSLARCAGELVRALICEPENVERHSGVPKLLSEVGLNARALADDRLETGALTADFSTRAIAAQAIDAE